MVRLSFCLQNFFRIVLFPAIFNTTIPLKLSSSQPGQWKFSPKWSSPILLYTTPRVMVSEHRPDCHRWVKQPDVKVKTTFLDRPALSAPSCSSCFPGPSCTKPICAPATQTSGPQPSMGLSSLRHTSSLSGPFTCSP